MAKAPKDMAASVWQRLLNLARKKGLAFDAVLVAFGLERLIYRLSISTHCDGFVLKGGMHVALRTSGSGRFTCDIDILALGSRPPKRSNSTGAGVHMRYRHPGFRVRR